MVLLAELSLPAPGARSTDGVYVFIAQTTELAETDVGHADVREYSAEVINSDSNQDSDSHDGWGKKRWESGKINQDGSAE